MRYDLAHDSASFFCGASFAAALSGGGAISFLSSAVILLPALTSSSGTPRSIASRTSD